MLKGKFEGAWLFGKVVGFAHINDWAKDFAIVQTCVGLAWFDHCMDANSWFPELKVGDDIEVEDGSFYILNGILITSLVESICINGKTFPWDSEAEYPRAERYKI